MKKTRRFLPSPSAVAGGLALGALATSAQAAVTLTSSSTFADQGTISGGASFTNFDLNGGNAVVALVSMEIGDTAATISATYDGVAMTQVGTVETASGFGQFASVFYLINPASTVADLSVTISSTNFGTDNTLAVSALGLANVTGVSDVAVGTETSGSGTEFDNGSTPFGYIGQAGGLSVAAYVDNTFGVSSAPTIGGVSQVLDTVISTQAGEFIAASGGSAGYFHGWGAIDADSNEILDQIIQGGSGSSREAGALVAFVPEPSVALLGGLGLLGLLRRRRA